MISRRVFLKNGAFAFVSVGFAPSFLARTASAAGATGRSKRLIAILQRGAVDGLSVVVPFGEASYYSSRPSIAIPRPGSGENAAIDLDGFFGFSPRLQPLKPLWDARQLAIVHACGSPDSTRSHFDEARPDDTSREAGSPFRAVALAQQLPRMLQGAAPALALNQVTQFDVRGGGGHASEMFEAAYASAPDRVLNGTGREAFEAIKLLKSTDPTKYQPENSAAYPPTPFGQALRQIAQLTKANLGLEVAFADIGGWDTHVNQGAGQGQLANRLDDFSRSIAALVADLGDRMEDTVVLTMSEFGRAVNENGNRGTDHGHGNAMLVIGGGVRGGHVYGKWPGLAADRRYACSRKLGTW